MPDLEAETEEAARRRRETGEDAAALEAELEKAEQAEQGEIKPAAHPDHASDGGVF